MARRQRRLAGCEMKGLMRPARSFRAAPICALPPAAIRPVLFILSLVRPPMIIQSRATAAILRNLASAAGTRCWLAASPEKYPLTAVRKSVCER